MSSPSAPPSRRRLLRTHARAARVLAHTLDLPATGRGGSLPGVEDEALGSWTAVVVRPTTPPPWPAIMFVNGATPEGRAHTVVRRLAASLARSGHVVLVPDLPGIASGELSPRTLDAAVACATCAADAAETRG